MNILHRQANYQHVLRVASFVALAVLLTGCVNIQPGSADQIIENIARQVPAFMRLVTAFSYIAGITFILRAIYKLKQYGDLRTMMSSNTELKGPFLLLLSGTFLLYFPTTVQMGIMTFWGQSVPFDFPADLLDSRWTRFYRLMFSLLTLVGSISFIRGLMMLSKLAEQGGGGPGVATKAMTHIAGGVLAINASGVFTVLKQLVTA